MAIFYDTHSHLGYPEFSADLQQVIERAQAAGITKIISIGIDWVSSKRAIQLAEQFSSVYAVVGWHPTCAMEAPEDLRPELRKLASHPKVVAIGETGLDFFRMPSQQPGGTPQDDERYKRKQAEIFEQQMEVAAEMGLNCVIHQRASFAETLEQARPFAGKVRGVFHCFAGTVEEMQQVLEIGSLVSFTGILTFKNGQTIRDVLAATPMNKFMLETDCPFLAPVPYRGKRCEPAYVKEISEAATQVKNCPAEKLSHATCQTAHDFFRNLG